jgi:hypothetical protein
MKVIAQYMKGTEFFNQQSFVIPEFCEDYLTNMSPSIIRVEGRPVLQKESRELV